MLLYLTAALAQEPPDPQAVLDAATAAVRSPSGCHVLQGEARDKWDAGVFGKGERVWTLSGTLQNGAWSNFTHVVKSGEPVEEKDRRGSLFGRMPWAEEEGTRVNVLEALEDEVTTEYLEPSGTGWRLTRTLRGGKLGRNVFTADVDQNRAVRTVRVLIVDPVTVKGKRGTARVVHTDATLTIAANGAPVSESMVARFAKWPFAVDITSTTTWSGSSCGG